MAPAQRCQGLLVVKNCFAHLAVHLEWVPLGGKYNVTRFDPQSIEQQFTVFNDHVVPAAWIKSWRRQDRAHLLRRDKFVESFQLNSLALAENWDPDFRLVCRSDAIS